MRICILFRSLRNNSNTALLLQPFINELKRFGADVDYITLKDKRIEPWGLRSFLIGCVVPILIKKIEREKEK